MNSQRNVARRLEDKVSNVESPPHDEQVPLLEENSNIDQAPANPSPMMETKKRSILNKMAQAMTTQAQDATVQDQTMMA